MPLPPGEKTRIFELCYDMALTTDGTTSTYYYDVDLPELEEGPPIESLQVLTGTLNRNSNHSWAVYVAWMNEGRTWSTPIALSADLVADGETVGAEVTAVSGGFAGRRIQVLLGTKNQSTSSRLNAWTRAWLVVRYRS